MRFTKMQGAGNDFVVVETNSIERDWAQLTRDTSDRHYGIGSDGLLLLEPSKVADFKMRVFNNDGTEAEACGNGIRCLVRYFVEKRGGYINEVTVETLAGIRKANLLKTGKETRVQVSMGKPQLEAKDIPVKTEVCEGKPLYIKSMISCPVAVDGKKLNLSLVSMGNPHAIHFSEKPVSEFPLPQIGPMVETHKIFPKHTNFEVVRVLSRKELEARVWEKGVGETLACGSGASGLTVAARLHGYVDSKVEVKLPGGTLGIEWDGVGEVFLSGPAETVFTGEWPD
ncbi:MAG: diaminopimelate epimerase [Chloroflexota bacterium]